MPLDARYAAQVRLLVQTLPFVAAEACFALKGGTAINLFVRNLPRLSVDIDLAYLPNCSRDRALKEARAALERIAGSVERGLPGVRATLQANRPDELRVLVRAAAAQIKIEVSPVLRGTVHPPEPRDVLSEVEEAFGFASMPVLSLPDLYGGKLCAALDRQHPRDLFDVKLLLDQGGLDRSVFEGFLVYLLGHPRPMNEVINPKMKPLEAIYRKEFVGMAITDIPLPQLEEVQSRLLERLAQLFTDDDARFLLSFKQGEPDWSLFPVQGVDQLPAVMWKLANIRKMGAEKHSKALRALVEALEKFR